MDTKIIVLGAAALVSVIGLVYYLISGPSKKEVPVGAPPSDGAEEEEDAETDDEESDAEEPPVLVESKKRVPAPVPASAAAAKSTPSTVAAPTPATKAAVVVDEVDEDEEEAETKAAAAEAKAAEEEAARALKEQYDGLASTALKYAKGEKYKQAIEKYSEALELLPLIPSARKDAMSIRNNRSAMYEKNREYENSLNDIAEILKTDKAHVKARTRRARILEIQEKHREAMVEYGFVVAFLQQKFQALSQQAQYMAPSAAMNAQAETLQKDIQSGAQKMEDLAKILAAQRSGQYLEDLRSGKNPRPLPCQAYCKNFLETFPSFYMWHELHADSSEDELLEAFTKYSNVDTYSQADLLEASYQLVSYYIVNAQYTRAFKYCAEALACWESKHIVVDYSRENTDVTAQMSAVGAETISAAMKLHLSVLLDLHGVEVHLKCNVLGAIQLYKCALELTMIGLNECTEDDAVVASQLSTHACELLLKLASAFVELGNQDEAEHAFDTIAASIENKEFTVSNTTWSVNNEAWMLIHRAALWVSRIRNAAQPTEDNVKNITKAVGDIKQSLVLIKKEKRNLEELDDSVEKTSNLAVNQACLLLSLIKSIQINVHYTQQMGVFPGADTDSSEEPAAQLATELQEKLELAMSIDADNDSVCQLDMEMRFYGNEFETAIEKCDAFIAKVEARAAALALQPKKEYEDDTNNAVPYILKANFLSQKAFGMLQEGMNPTPVVEEMEALFHKAMELEPGSVDAMIQYANIKTLFGAPQVSAEYTDKALPHARNLQEILDILQLNEMTKAQAFVLHDVVL